MNKLKKHQRYFYVFLILSVLGVVEIATQSAVSSQYDISDIGYVALFVAKALAFINPTIAGGLAVAIHTILAFTIIWIGITIFEYRRIQKLKKENSN